MATTLKQNLSYKQQPIELSRKLNMKRRVNIEIVNSGIERQFIMCEECDDLHEVDHKFFNPESERNFLMCDDCATLDTTSKQKLSKDGNKDTDIPNTDSNFQAAPESEGLVSLMQLPEIRETLFQETEESCKERDDNETESSDVLDVTEAVENLLVLGNGSDNDIVVAATPCSKVHATESSKVRRLRFHQVTIREYPRVLGDNVCMMGVPISISWEHQGEKVYDLEEYEEACSHTRRTQTELKIPSSHRNTLLRETGYSAKEIQEAIKRSNITRNQRKRTVEMLKMHTVHEALEKVARFGKKIIPHRKKKKPITRDK